LTQVANATLSPQKDEPANMILDYTQARAKITHVDRNNYPCTAWIIAVDATIRIGVVSFPGLGRWRNSGLFFSYLRKCALFRPKTTYFSALSTHNIIGEASIFSGEYFFLTRPAKTVLKIDSCSAWVYPLHPLATPMHNICIFKCIF